MNRLTIALCLSLLATPVLAVQPDEILPDPALEARAREISKLLRCPVCQGENIDDSNADISRDLRLLVRERIRAGDTNDQVIGFLRARYGDFVLLRPPLTAATAALWFSPVLVVAGGVLTIWLIRRRGRSAPAAPQPLTPEEEARLAALEAEGSR